MLQDGKPSTSFPLEWDQAKFWNSKLDANAWSPANKYTESLQMLLFQSGCTGNKNQRINDLAIAPYNFVGVSENTGSYPWDWIGKYSLFEYSR